MVRKASRLPPATTSVEEILLARLAGNSGGSARPSARSTSHRQAPRTAARTGVLSEPAATASLEALRAMESDISGLDARLQGLASALLPPPSSAPAAAASRSSHESEIERFVQESIRVLSLCVPPKASAGAALPDAAATAQVAHGVRELRSTVRRLDRVFLEAAAGGDSQRQLAATAISALARGFLCRRRFFRLRSALGAWRARGCAGFLGHVAQFSAREAFLSEQAARLGAARQAAWLRRVLAELRDVALLRLPLRARQREESDRRFQARQLALLRRVLSPWKAAALGPRSRKQAARRARARHLAARERLEASDRFEVVTADMVHAEFLRANVRQVRAGHAAHVQRMLFRLLRDALLLPLRRNAAAAAAHARRAALRRAWRAWLPVFRAQQVDKAIAAAASAAGKADGDASQRRQRRAPTLERFDKPVNLRRVDAHYRMTLLRRLLRAWRRRRALLRRVRALFEASTRAALGLRVRKWRLRAQYQRALRVHAVESWHAYGRRLSQTPFRAWYVFTAGRRARHAAQRRVCAAFARRARRQAKFAVFRVWKHQALFGAAEGALSRLQLLQALEQQKRLSLSLEANAALLRENVAALRASAERLEDKLLEKQQELAAAFADAQAARFALHAAEQGVARAHGLLEAVRAVHPGSVAAVERAAAEQPLLALDLRAVLARCADARARLLARLERDETAARVCDAAGCDDLLLLHRVKWVLSRLDLAADHSEDDRTNDDRQEDAAAAQLCALFEFVRDGDTRALAPANDPARGRGALLDWSERYAGGGRDPYEEDGGGGAPRVRRRELMARAEPWSAFVRALALQFVPDKMRGVRERLLARAQAADDELQELKASPHIYNLYSGSAQPQ